MLLRHPRTRFAAILLALTAVAGLCPASAQIVPVRLPAPPLGGLPASVGPLLPSGLLPRLGPALPALGPGGGVGLPAAFIPKPAPVPARTTQEYSRAVESKYRVGDKRLLPEGLRERSEFIGRGSFGSVLLGVSPGASKGREDGRFAAGTPVAVKRNTHYGKLEAMAYEAEMLGRVAAADPGGLFVRGEFDGELGVLVMEYLDGYVPLTQWVHARRAPSLETLERAAGQLARIPAVLRAAGVVHGDLKPDNVLVNARGELKVIDLGLAAPEGSYNPHLGGQRHGSEQYSSENQRNNGPAAFGDDEFSVSYLMQVVRSRMPPR